MGFFATFRTEALAYAKYILQTRPEAKIGVLYANDETALAEAKAMLAKAITVGDSPGTAPKLIDEIIG